MRNLTLAIAALLLAATAGTASAGLYPATNDNIFLFGNMTGSFSAQGPFVVNTVASDPTAAAMAMMNLDITADCLAEQFSTGATNIASGAVTFTGASAGSNIFNISAPQLEDAIDITVDIPAGADAIVNVTGYGAVNLPDAAFNFNPAHTLWNFDGFSTLTTSSFSGSVLAPYANVTFNAGTFNGTLVANSLTGAGQFNQSLFTDDFDPAGDSEGAIHPDLALPEPASLSLLALGSLALLTRRRKT